MAFPSFIFTFYFSIFYFYFPCLIIAQQPYAGNNCRRNESTALGYSCNGVNRSCQTFLIYRTQPPYNSVSSIATLFSANASQVSSFNKNIAENMTLATNTKVIIPVTCSCVGRFYQTNTTRVVRANIDNYYTLANDTFEGLTTCRAIRAQKVSPNIVNIYPDEKLTIPLRCACPTRRQLNLGIKYLVSFVIQPSNTAIGNIAIYFGADVGQTLEANEKSEQDDDINPFTTLLIPLQTPPNVSKLEYLPYVPPPTASSPSFPPIETVVPSGKSSKKWVYFGLGAVTGGVFILLAGLIAFFMFFMRKKNDPNVSLQNFEAQGKGLVKKAPEKESLEFLESISRIASLKVYSFMDLQAATENFSSDHWIIGSVYRGNISGDEVAIKKMDGDVCREISVLNKINHFNLVRLLGVCFDDGVWYFVYEYASNGPLKDWIFHENPDGKTLSWGMRMQVACDVATGLNYLHSYTNPPHIHKDIRSSNVLLNNEFRGKIAKFGLSRPIKGNDGQFTFTKHIVGMKGYLAPEYLENGVISPMLDVYAFGVLLLEMLTGKDVASLYEGVKVHLSEILIPVLSVNGISSFKEFMDSSLGEDYPTDIAYNMLVLVDRCLRKDPGKRPFMDEIVQILSKSLTTSLIWGSSNSASVSSP